MVVMAKTTVKNMNSFKISMKSYMPETVGTRPLQRNESTSSNSSGNNTSGSIGTTLGRQEHKILHVKQLMEKQLQQNKDLLRLHSSTVNSKLHPEISNSAQHDSEYRKQALQARWEKTVQHEAKGFMVKNVTDIKSVEAELKGTIGKTLGRQGYRIVYAKQLMEKELQQYNDLVKSHSSKENSMIHPDVIKSAHNYNEYRRQALQARWELIVQRQAAGFVVNNHDYVTEQYPIAVALPVHDLNSESGSTMNEKSTAQTSSSVEKDFKVKFTDQLQSWWERIARWH